MATETTNKKSNDTSASKILKELTKLRDTTLSPWQKGAQKRLEELGALQVDQATAQGMHPEQLADKAGLSGEALLSSMVKSAQPQGMTPSMGVAGVNQMSQGIPQQGMQQSQQPQGRSLMSKLLMSVGGGLAAAGGQGEIVNGLLRYASEENRLKQESMQQAELDKTLIEQRKYNTELMRRQLEGGDAQIIYRDPITGEEVSPEQAQKDMEEGLGIYQMNQVTNTRNGVVEKPLNKVPELTESEKKYIVDAKRISQTLGTMQDTYEKLQDRFKNSKASWQIFQTQSLPYALTQDQDIQNFKSDLIRLKADIPFLRGGKQLTATEAKRVDSMLNPFGKSPETYSKDIKSFESEFMYGTEISKYGINVGLMKKFLGKSVAERNKEESAGNNQNIGRFKVEME